MLWLCQGRIGFKAIGGVSSLKSRDAVLHPLALFHSLSVLYAHVLRNQLLVTNLLPLTIATVEGFRVKDTANQVKSEAFCLHWQWW